MVKYCYLFKPNETFDRLWYKLEPTYIPGANYNTMLRPDYGIFGIGKKRSHISMSVKIYVCISLLNY